MAWSLRIGVNALFLIPGGVGGSEIYLRQLLAAIAADPRQHKYLIFTNHETGLGLAPDHPQFETIQTSVRATSRPFRILYEQLALPFRAAKVDVMFNAGLTAPLPLLCPNVTMLFDMQHHRHPEFYRPADLLATRVLLSASARWSRSVITLSEASRSDIQSIYGIPEEHIQIASPGVDNDLMTLRRGKPEPMILYVSTLHPHKNHRCLIDAFAAFRRRYPGYRLVFAGLHGFQYHSIRKQIQELKLEDCVVTTGWISRPAMLDLYRTAEFAVFASRFEGFGIPVLEAMTAGVPLIVSDVAPMRDIAGCAALRVAPTDTQAWADALSCFASSPDLRDEYARRGLERAAMFRWDRTAATVLNALEQAGNPVA